MAFSLADIKTGRDLKPPRVVITGTQGIGKSTFASQFPSPVFLPTEDGLHTIDCAKFPRASKESEVLEAITSLYTENHNFKTLVIDSIDWYEKLVHDAVRELYGDKIFTDFGKGYTFSVPYFSKLLEALSALRDHREMAIVLVGHVAIKRFDAPDTAGYDRYVPDLHEKVGSLVVEWADVVLFANYKVYVSKEDAGFGKKVGKGLGQADRVIYTEERPAWKAKNRYNLPPELPLDYSAFSLAMEEGLKKNPFAPQKAENKGKEK